MNNQKDKMGMESFIQQLQANPELLKQQPELFQKAVIECLASMTKRLSEIENRWMTPLIK